MYSNIIFLNENINADNILCKSYPDYGHLFVNIVNQDKI